MTKDNKRKERTKNEHVKNWQLNVNPSWTKMGLPDPLKSYASTQKTVFFLNAYLQNYQRFFQFASFIDAESFRLSIPKKKDWKILIFCRDV